jgi:hypothetical protein
MTDATNLTAADSAAMQHRLDAAVADSKEKLAQWIELNAPRGRVGAMISCPCVPVPERLAA